MRGIALLISVIIVSIVLAVSVGVSNIVSTEISLSNTSRQSQLAFYASDAGVDCAIYWDTIHSGFSKSAFATSTPLTNFINNACSGDNVIVGGRLSCVNGLTGNEGWNICFDPSLNDKRAGRSTFILSFDNGSCAIVTVKKRQDPLLNPTGLAIDIHSDGYSSGGGNDFLGFATCSSNSPRRFQRSIEVTTYE